MTPKEVIAKTAWDSDSITTPDDLLQALTAAGYAVVPLEPTKSMVKAVLHVLDTVPPPRKENGPIEGIRPLWEAMIAAAQEEGR